MDTESTTQQMHPTVQNIVQETTDYGMFSLIDSNREQSRGHIEALKIAYEEMGNLTRVQPILINEKYQIIDGQHRFMASKDMGVPIYFTVVPGLGIRHARSMNILHRSWGVDDFAQSYATDGNINYQKYLDIRQDYGFSHSTTLTYIMGADVRGMFKVFRAGDLTIPDETVARDRLDSLIEIEGAGGFAKDHKFAVALLKAIQAEGYDHNRMLRKLNNSSSLLHRLGTVAEYQRMLEEIYNHGMSEGNRVRLY